VELFENLKVLTDEESHSRYHILLEKYAKDLDIEAKLVCEMTTTLFVPAALDYQNKLGQALLAQKAAGAKSPAQASLLRDVSARVESALNGVESLQEAREAADALEDVEKKAAAYCDKVKPYFEKIRADIDSLELILPADAWPVPKYREMLFLM
jgi:glutamine synthetase